MRLLRDRRLRPIDLMVFEGDRMALMGTLVQAASLLAHVIGSKGEPVTGGRRFDVGEETLHILSPTDFFDEVKLVFGSDSRCIRVIFDDGSLRGRDDLAGPMLTALEAIIAKLDEHSRMTTLHHARTWNDISGTLVRTKGEVGEFQLPCPWSPFAGTDDDGNDLRGTLPEEFVEEMDAILPIAVTIDLYRDDEGTSVSLTPVLVERLSASGGDALTAMRLTTKLERRRDVLRTGLREPWTHAEWSLAS